MASDYGMAEHVLGHKAGGEKTGKKPSVKPMKSFKAEELHDGTYGIEKHHGMSEDGFTPVKPVEKGSAKDVDGVIDHLHEHFGSNVKHEEGEKEKKQGHNENAKEEGKKDKATAEEDEKPGDAENDEK
jgi:hypothetical protein